MRKFLFLLMAVLVVSSCSANDFDTLNKAILDDSLTIEATMNAFAGLNGSVSWSNPSGQPKNVNFKLLGAKVSNPTGAADYVFMVDTTTMTATVQTITFNGKTVHYDLYGLPDDFEVFQEIMEWALKNAMGL